MVAEWANEFKPIDSPDSAEAWDGEPFVALANVTDANATVS